MISKSIKPIWALILISLLCHCGADDDREYEEFVNRLRADEAYIGFFATESACISDIHDEYLNSRKKFFLAVNRAQEEPDGAIERFIEYCRKRSIIDETCES